MLSPPLNMKQQIVKPPISKKQIEILVLLYQFKFLNTKLIQKLLKHNLPTRIQQWLKDLTIKEYVHKFYDETSFAKRTEPAVYCLSSKARSILKTQENVEKSVLDQIYRTKDFSEEFRNHCVFVADTLINLRDIYKKEDKDISLRFFTKVLLTGFDYFPKPFPDAYFVIEQKGKHKKRYLLEVFDLNIPKRALKERIRRYITAAEGSWKEATGSKFPVVLLILRNKYKQRNIKKLIQTVKNEEFSYLPFYLTNKEAIKERGLENILWEKVGEY